MWVTHNLKYRTPRLLIFIRYRLFWKIKRTMFKVNISQFSANLDRTCFLHSSASRVMPANASNILFRSQYSLYFQDRQWWRNVDPFRCHTLGAIHELFNDTIHELITKYPLRPNYVEFQCASDRRIVSLCSRHRRKIPQERRQSAFMWSSNIKRRTNC